MTLLERMNRCRFASCRRAPASPELAFCPDHLPTWSAGKPAWVSRAMAAQLKPKVYSA